RATHDESIPIMRYVDAWKRGGRGATAMNSSSKHPLTSSDFLRLPPTPHYMHQSQHRGAVTSVRYPYPYVRIPALARSLDDVEDEQSTSQARIIWCGKCTCLSGWGEYGLLRRISVRRPV